MKLAISIHADEQLAQVAIPLLQAELSLLRFSQLQYVDTKTRTCEGLTKQSLLDSVVAFHPAHDFKTIISIRTKKAKTIL